jgi:hypothetical protein
MFSIGDERNIDFSSRQLCWLNFASALHLDPLWRDQPPDQGSPDCCRYPWHSPEG